MTDSSLAGGVPDQAPPDVVDTWRNIGSGPEGPLIVTRTLQRYLDELGLGSGPIQLSPIGDGHSNVTYRIARGRSHFVLRRPPRGPLPASAHDVLREGRLLQALAGRGVRVPSVLALCEDAAVIGAPFYLMPFVDGLVLSDVMPDALAAAGGRAIAEQVVDSLVAVHAVPVREDPLASLARPSGYLDRQLQRFGALLAENATRPLTDLERVRAWLSATRPESSETTLVHGDYRLGNVMFAPELPPRIVAVLDWEMATLGDPLADVGYLTATWAEPDDPKDPMLNLSGLTRQAGFPGRDVLVQRYSERSGRDVTTLLWYQVLAIWKSAIFLEASYRRYLAGTTADGYFAALGDGVPVLARRALRMTGL